MTVEAHAWSPATERPWNHGIELARATWWLGVRAVRNVLREPVNFLPAIMIPLFFYFVMSASLEGFAAASGLANYKAFALPVSILFAVTNDAIGASMVVDIERGYFDKLVVTPASRVAIVVGAMSANFVRVVFQGLIVTFLAMAFGLDIATGFVGAILMVLLASLWGIAYGGLGLGVAIRTGSANATVGAQVMVFPLMFLTTSFAPREALSGWLKTAVAYNPITYLLEGMRSFSLTGWDVVEVGKGLIAVGALGVITVAFSLSALRSRLR